jgi:hypothetical protein
MMKYLKSTWYMVITIIFISFFVLFLKEGNAADKIPTIEDLTNGKVKIGDLVDKNNVDLVKDYLGVSVYEVVKNGMVLRMANQISPRQFYPKQFYEATERNKGKAVIDENGTVYLKDGSIWPGGFPFPETKTGLEIMANVKFGRGWDDNYSIRTTSLINKDGKVYITNKAVNRYLAMTGRLTNPPLGTFPGYEHVSVRLLSVLKYPRHLAGLVNYIVKYYDDAKNPDTGFIYLPAFKKTIRFTTTNYQDLIQGNDMTKGDVEGLREPFSNWKFKHIKTCYMLFPEPKSPFPLFDKKGNLSNQLKFDVEQKYPRLGWTVYPIHIVEAKCKHNHIYGKKILYVHAYPYWPCKDNIVSFDAYNPKMQLWKNYLQAKGHHYILDGEPYTNSYGGFAFDLQINHSTQTWLFQQLNRSKYKPKDVTFKQLIEFGR